jgi:excisionase family DNA binding protein
MQSMQTVHVGPPVLLTARQVQHMLGVDRSTVYRMAEDGRLPAVKVGRQWRFRPAQIEAVLDDEPATPGGGATALVDMAADLLGVTMVVTDMRGQPLTTVANPCPWFTAHADDADAIAACVAEWRQLADDLDVVPRFRLGPVGFECARAFVRTGTSLVGMVLAGGVAAPGTAPEGLHKLDDEGRRRVLAALPVVAAAVSRALSRQTRTDGRSAP